MNALTRVIALTTVFSLLAACAGNPSAPVPRIAEEDFRDADLDLIFATEFPVASKAEALEFADEAIKTNELDRALFYYVKALMFDPVDADLLTRIGTLHQFRGNAVLAVRSYSLALQANPAQVAALEGRGLIALDYEQDELALNDLLRATELDAGAWRSQNALGLLAVRRGDHEAAESYFTLAINARPDSGMLYNNRGYSRLQAGRSALAEVDLRRAAEQLGYRQAWVNLGALYARERSYDAAIQSYSEIFKTHEALNKTAELAIDNRDFRVASDLLEQAIASSPTWYADAEENLLQIVRLAGDPASY